MNFHSIALQCISKKFKQTLIFKDVLCQFQQGRRYAITGSSGSGKSTLLKIITGFLEPSSGDVLLGDTSRKRLSSSEYDAIRARYFGFVFQDAQLLPELTAQENVMISLLLIDYSYKRAMQEAQRILQLVEMASFAQYYPYELSGGQQQRVALARALVKRPVFLCADEPTGNLDVQTARSVIDLLVNSSKEFGVGLIISSHDSMLISRMQKIYAIESQLVQEKDLSVFKKDVTQKDHASGWYYAHEQITGNGS